MPTLALRGPPTSQPVPRSTDPLVLLGWRMPALVAPPPEGEICLIPLGMRPCNIAVDPRLCKGSVFAEQRRRALRSQVAGSEDVRETNYRVNVLRSRLETSLPQVATSNQPRRASTYRNGFHPPQKSSSLKSPSPKMPVQLPSLSPASIDKGFRKMKFVPLKNATNVGGEERQKKIPSRVVPALGRVRVRAPALVDEAPTPPCSERKEYPIVDSGVQTDDTFEEETAELIADLANSAISQALHNLQLEETMIGMEQRTEVIRKQLEKERRQKREFEKSAKAKIEEQEKTIQDRKEWEEKALASHRLAVITCREITEKAFANLKRYEEENPKVRSIGMDTRALNKIQTKMDLITAELEKDFFPWIFKKAEKIFRKRLVETELQGENYRRNRAF